ncbi:alpha/beta hydrolase [Thalassotalea ponticola]|uniref:alpha/beta fold hydrolase n=1 Tax=Thalassotalea ponticola TaxID=1523392 RepID=UPI0025B5312E|nr:alpha/beta hydrolase [Thalassotalea ponticola]MDN3651825.1 alpha/beta hydrolase [Thalassotalea ponticola]
MIKLNKIRSLLAVFSLLLITWSSLAKQAPVVVFVHGSWGGGWDYKTMQSLLQQRGFVVYRPTLTGLGERVHLNTPDVNLDTHILDIVNLIVFEELDDVILVGHSYGGMVISGVADKIPEKIKHLVYMDALLPEHGESVFSLSEPEYVAHLKQLADNNKGQEWAIPPYWPDWGKDVPHPMATYQQPISLTNPKAKNIAATYVLAVEPSSDNDSFKMFAERAKQRNYRYLELPTSHNMQRTMPERYADIINDLR